MTSEELEQIKAEVKPYLSEIGYARWHKHMVKCLRTLPVKEARNEIWKYANELANKEVYLKLRNQGEL